MQAFSTLSAGDILDSSIRSYRRNFWTLIRLSAPPILVAAFGMVLLTTGWRGGLTASMSGNFVFYAILLGLGAFLCIGGYLSTMMVMGAATRSLVRHLLFDEPIKVRDTYKAVRQRFWGLLWAVLLVSIFIAFITPIAFYGWLFLAGLSLVGVYYISSYSTGLAFFIGILLNVAIIAAASYIYFLIVGRFVYVPQALMVEGISAGAAISRSTSLARKNSWRLMALVLFSIFAVYSVITLLIVPIVWYAWANGIELYGFGNDLMPKWFLITSQVIFQLALILLLPILMMGLSLLYVDERVRREGYDIELLATRHLGEVPARFNSEYNPLKPALVTLGEVINSSSEKDFSPLGLK